MAVTGLTGRSGCVGDASTEVLPLGPRTTGVNDSVQGSPSATALKPSTVEPILVLNASHKRLLIDASEERAAQACPELGAGLPGARPAHTSDGDAGTGCYVTLRNVPSICSERFTCFS